MTDVTYSFEKTLAFSSAPQIVVNARMGQLKALAKNLLLELNIFKNHGSNETQVRYQRISTRLYIVLIVISLAILAFYLSLTTKIYRGTVRNPTESQYTRLQEIYPNSLSCPCTVISMNYSTFIIVEPHYHQVCSSDLLRPAWISYTAQITANDPHIVGDYRIDAKTQFLLLKTFCQLAQQTVDDARQDFLQSLFVSSQVIPQQFMVPQMKSLIQDWISTTVNQFVRTINLFRAITQTNQLTNGYSDVAPVSAVASREAIMKPQMYSNCSCDLLHSCKILMFVYDLKIVSNDFGIEPVDVTRDDYGPYRNFFYHPPNFFASCSPIEALLSSTLQCFYSLSCVMTIDYYMGASIVQWLNFSTLDSTHNSPYETIEQIINNATVDLWSYNVSFTSYYNSCAPLSCTYEYESRNDLFSIAITIIGVFSGLLLGFKLLILMMLQLADKIMIGFSRLAVKSFIKNLFSCHDEQQTTSRLHFILVVATLTVLYTFYAFTPQSITVLVENPSLLTYQDLTRHFSDSLQCPCAKISIQYQWFLTMVPHFHEVCSSDFVSNDWLTHLYDEGSSTYQYVPMDFRYSATNQFKLLNSLCQLSRETVTDSLLQLATSAFVNSQLLPLNLLNERISTTINQVKLTMPSFFIRTLSLIRETTGANMIISTLPTNWVIITTLEANDPIGVDMIPLVYTDCNCGCSSKCVQPSRGMMAGCYPLEALFQSTLECLYDQQCIDPTNTFKAMNTSSSKASHFNANATIESIVNQLMIEEYSSNTSYEKYFHQCAPLSCTYSYIDKSNIIEGITNLISLYGGLMIICRLIAMLIVWLFRRRTQRIRPAAD